MNFQNDRPIYLQIFDYLVLLIVTDKYKVGEKIPSVRELATFFKVNPNTMQKALSELEEEGLIYTERTNGKFVTNDGNIIKNYKEKIALDKTLEYLKSMKELGFPFEEVLEKVKNMGKDAKI